MVLNSDGSINRSAWSRAGASGEIVGTCRACDGYMAVDDPPAYDEPALEWFIARCLSCEQEAASPGGRTLRKSGRASERGTH